MSILDKIIENKKKEVAYQKEVVSVAHLKGHSEFGRKCHSLRSALLKPDSSGIIAEFKHRSPSKGEINFSVKVEKVTKEYIAAGATGLSVLTDHDYFGGTMNELAKARSVNPGVPILRKDFIIDTYQIVEAKAYGADVILLIAACLEKEQARVLACKAKDLGMDVILEVHHEPELENLNDFVDIVGVNNRDLKTFVVSTDTSVRLSGMIPGRYLKISESGLASTETIRYLKQYGYNGFLIGETFMKTENPGVTCKKFISEL